jgi:hypothetical protein
MQAALLSVLIITPIASRQFVSKLADVRFLAGPRIAIAGLVRRASCG